MVPLFMERIPLKKRGITQEFLFLGNSLTFLLKKRNPEKGKYTLGLH
jgi:hypothetical protein